METPLETSGDGPVGPDPGGRLCAVLDGLAVPLLLVDGRTGHVLQANDEARQLLGYGGMALPVVHGLLAGEAEVDRFEEIVEHTAIHGTAGPAPLCFRTREGRTIDVEVRTCLATAPGPAVLLALTAQEPSTRGGPGFPPSELETLLDTTEDMVTIVDAEGRIVYQSPAASRLLGRSPEGRFGREALEFVHPDDREGAEMRLRRGLAAGGLERFTYRVRHADGSYRMFQSSGRAYTDARGRRRGIVLSRDVTEQVRAEDALRRRDAQYSLVLRSLPIAFYAARPEGDFGRTWVTEGIEELCGVPPEHFLHHPGLWVSRIHPEDLTRILEVFRALRPGRPMEVLYRWQTAKGQYRWFRDAGVLLGEGADAEIVGVWLDVTEQLEVREHLLRSESRSALAQLVSGVAHELNNPLTAVLGFAHLLLEREGLDEELRGPLGRIAAEAARARRIVGNFLAFAPRRGPERELASVNDLLKQVADFRSYELTTSNIRLSLDLDERVPPSLVDAHQLQQAFLNLLLNSEQAIRADGSGGRIGLTSLFEEEFGRVVIRVEDDGPGMSREVAARAFEPFFTTKPEGTGLGLSVVQGILSEHGGEVRLVGGEGRRTVFEAVLPVSALVPPRDDLAGESDVGALAGRRILVVDDEEAILELVQATLEPHGAVVRTAMRVQRALEFLEREPIDAVVSDVKMPERGGVQFYALCREEWPGLADRFLFLTGDVVPDREFIEVQGERLPVLRKPFDLDEFVRRVAALLTPLNGAR